MPEFAAGGLKVADFQMKARRGPSSRVTHRIVLSGQGRPGFIAKFTALLDEHGANIVRVNAGKVEGATAISTLPSSQSPCVQRRCPTASPPSSTPRASSSSPSATRRRKQPSPSRLARPRASDITGVVFTGPAGPLVRPIAQRAQSMNIHEHQAKELLAGYGVAVLPGVALTDPEEAEAAAAELCGPVWVVKAQIHAGGRGKAGGVKLAKSAAEAAELARTMFGQVLVTHQTGPSGKEVHRVYIEQGCDIARELYLGCVIDRASGRVTFMVSTEGGMEIEEVAAKTPEKIHHAVIDPAIGLQPFHARKIAFALGLEGASVKATGKFVAGLYDAFVALDASLLEINPLVVTNDGELVALDAKMNFDDNALYRHPEVSALRDESEEDPTEREAAKHELSYVNLDGNIGCMVNGAGLAMATMDIIKLHGGEPANFLDVGGGATQGRVATAFKLILSDPNVEGILVNIFGGIMRCDVIAEGVVEAARELSLTVPLVVRLEGTNVEQGKAVMAASGLSIVSADDLGDAAEKIVAALGKAS